MYYETQINHGYRSGKQESEAYMAADETMTVRQAEKEIENF